MGHGAILAGVGGVYLVSEATHTSDLWTCLGCSALLVGPCRCAWLVDVSHLYLPDRLNRRFRALRSGIHLSAGCGKPVAVRADVFEDAGMDGFLWSLGAPCRIRISSRKSASPIASKNLVLVLSGARLGAGDRHDSVAQYFADRRRGLDPGGRRMLQRWGYLPCVGHPPSTVSFDLALVGVSGLRLSLFRDSPICRPPGFVTT